ncbi:DUF6968 family protein [Nocardia wallacei]|uniref:DUF6968 family protein n=1 Tax=Nocardia wallacei TaxID=480035 RepID=UPI002458AB8C|nr:hypothetical protein [Nocardia wallacei]
MTTTPDPIATRHYDARDGVPVTVEVDRPFYDNGNDCWRCVWRITGLGRGPEPYDGFGLGSDSAEALVYALWGAESVLSDPRNIPPITLDGDTDLRLPKSPSPPLSSDDRAEIEALLPPPPD